ncbi:hypothetical protein PGRAT_16630 [Paenibacillus graminis]|uniref:Uncharacterized protein n=1 Tax=Paenibacillus graminis TaxID=189425 RepID=A0A089MC52_9BACL|nr:hypothetical protein PGRAT_16630 [Paenibacillus graminis]
MLTPYTEKDSPRDKQSILDKRARTTEGEIINVPAAELAAACARAEGEAKGEAEAKKEVARKLLALEVDLAVIAEASGLSEEEIRTLKPLQ